MPPPVAAGTDLTSVPNAPPGAPQTFLARSFPCRWQFRWWSLRIRPFRSHRTRGAALFQDEADPPRPAGRRPRNIIGSPRVVRHCRHHGASTIQRASRDAERSAPGKSRRSHRRRRYCSGITVRAAPSRQRMLKVCPSAITPPSVNRRCPGFRQGAPVLQHHLNFLGPAGHLGPRQRDGHPGRLHEFIVKAPEMECVTQVIASLA